MGAGGGNGRRFGLRGPGGPRGLARQAERAAELEQQRALCLLLLPSALEAFALREEAEDLLTGPGVIAVEPARVSYRSYLRMPPGVGDGLAAVQARRLRLPGTPRVLVIFHPLQYPLARALISQHRECELWYCLCEPLSAPSKRRRERLDELHDAAAYRAAYRFAPGEEGTAHERNRPLWERMERLGVESGRLGSERVDIA